MPNESHYLDITLLGKEYRVACPPEERDALQNAVAYVDARMREIAEKTHSNIAERIAVMAALNITHDLLHKQEIAEVQTSSSTREQVRDLLERVDLVLATDPNERQS